MPTRHLRDLPTAELVEEYDRRDLASWSDQQLVDAAAELIAGGSTDRVTSFVLHAPLELSARSALLPRVAPPQRRLARLRIAWLAARHAEVTEASPVGSRRDGDPARTATLLLTAIERGEIDDARRLGRGLASMTSADELVALTGDGLVPRLGAAGHGAIFLHLLPRFAAGSVGVAAMFGNLTAELATRPGPTLRWQHGTGRRRTRTPLESAIGAVPSLPRLDSDFIAPNVIRIEQEGVADEILRPALGEDLDVAAAARSLARLAAEAMIRGPASVAPYTWTHALTIPLALGVVAPRTDDPVATIGLAATHLAGFLAPNGGGAVLGASDVPEPTPDSVTSLATAAAVHHDAHVAKYAVAAADAARSDPAAAPRFALAATRLLEAWREDPPVADPLAAQLAA